MEPRSGLSEPSPQLEVRGGLRSSCRGKELSSHVAGVALVCQAGAAEAGCLLRVTLTDLYFPGDNGPHWNFPRFPANLFCELTLPSSLLTLRLPLKHVIRW